VSLPLDRRAREVLPDEERVRAHDRSVYSLRERRDGAVSRTPDWEALCRHAEAIKAHTLDHLGDYLAAFEEKARSAGAVVHWAEDAEAHNETVYALLRERGVSRIVKSKSMLTEDCGLNPWLEARGIEITDTDLGERIVQLAGERPSHILAPAVHKSRQQISALFHETMATPSGETDPTRLVEHARRDLRGRFLAAEAGVTGVNFAIAETGSIVVVTNEGNADLGMSLPPLHIACMGIEKVIPRLEDLAVFTRLLARSATGQDLSVYTSLLTGPRDGGELHIVLVDDGRTRLLADPQHAQSLRCIRCSACLNTCPVYRRAGGHAYGYVIPGPLGAVLAPALEPGGERDTLPFASSLCGSCSAVCPVRIDLHGQLLAWRRERPALGPLAGAGLRAAGRVFERPALFRLAGRAARLLWPMLSRRFPGNPASAWLHGRELPAHPGESFRQRYLRERGRGA
jgi:L-lactate dehydrogenase complex protein LldF